MGLPPVAQQTPEQRRREKQNRINRERGISALVPLGPSQRHLRMLYFRYGMSCARLGQLAGLSTGQISEMIRGDRGPTRGKIYPMINVKRETERRVLAVQPEAPRGVGGARLDATGTVRRAQGLAALGYPLTWQAERTGIHLRNMQGLVRGERGKVLYSTAVTVRELYEKFENELDPTKHGITSHAMNICLHAARVNEYVKPIFWDWDTIDDPEGFPDYTGQCGTHFGAQAHRRKGILPICQPCRDAYNEYNGEKKSARRVDKAAGSAVL